MFNAKPLLIFFLLFSDIAHGGILLGENCDDVIAVSWCFDHIEAHTKYLGQNLNLENYEQRKGYKNSCEPVLDCLFEFTQCELFDPEEFNPLIISMKTHCDVAAYIDESLCYRKLKNNHSECFKEWNRHLTQRKVMKAERGATFVQNVACKNYFGKYQCVEKEMDRMCGKGEWAAFRALFSDYISSVWQDCEIADVVNGMTLHISGKSSSS